MSADVILKLVRVPVQLVIAGGRGAGGQQGNRGPGAVIGANFAFEGVLLDGEVLPGFNVYQAATYNNVTGWCRGVPSTDAVFHLYNKTVDTGLTVTFPAGETDPILSAPLDVVAGDYIWPKAPSPAVGSLSDPAFVLFTT